MSKTCYRTQKMANLLYVNTIFLFSRSVDKQLSQPTMYILQNRILSIYKGKELEMPNLMLEEHIFSIK